MSYNSKYTGAQIEAKLDAVDGKYVKPSTGIPASDLAPDVFLQGEKGDKGDKGDTGATGPQGVGVTSVVQTTTSSADGGSNVVTVTLSNGTKSTFTVKNGSKGSQGVQGPKGDTGATGANGTNGKDGADGEDGATFTPSVDANGNLSWTNNKGLSNPPTVNIKGPKGDKGDAGSGGSGGGSGAYAEVNHGISDTTFTLTPNTFHVWDEVSALTLTLGSETAGVANEYLFQFTSGATATSLTLSDDIKWANDTPPTIAENMIYQVSVLKGFASVLEFSNAVPIIQFYIVAMGQTFPYNCRKNTTWSEFVDSEFNNGTYKLEIKDGSVCVKGPIANMYFSITGQTPSDIIEEGVTYTTT